MFDWLPSSSGHYQLILPFGQYQRKQPPSGKIVSSKSIHVLPIPSTKTTPRYILRQQTKHPKSSFKSLLIVKSSLLQHQRMSLIQSVPEGLKREEVERGNGSLLPPISFIPQKHEAEDEHTTPTIKIELSNGVESRVAVWDGIGTPEQFLSHMIAMRDALDGMGLFASYEEARKRVSEKKEEVQQEKALRDVVLEQIDNTILEADKEPLREEAANHVEAIKALQTEVAAAKQERVTAMATVFATTSNFFRGDGKAPWDKIVHEQTEKDPWINLRGVEQAGARGKTLMAWRDCYTLMLKTVFANNAAEQQKFYITLLKLPHKQKLRAFLQRVTKLAGYVGELPSIIHSSDATDATKPVEPYGDGELATIMLHAMPHRWQTQYNMGHKAPANSGYLLDAMEKIELAIPLRNDRGSSKNKVSFSKMTKMTDKIPKKKSQAAKHEKASAKSCALCKKYGGASGTHNTGECKKYDHQGNLKKGFKGRKDFSTNTPPGTNKSYAQLYAETKKLKSSNKKFKRALKKSSKKHKKRKYASSSESESSDSDSD